MPVEAMLDRHTTLIERIVEAKIDAKLSRYENQLQEMERRIQKASEMA